MTWTDRIFSVLYRRQLRKNYMLPNYDELFAVIRKVSGWCDAAVKDLGSIGRMELLDFIIEAVKADLQSSVGTELIYAGSRAPRIHSDELAPFSGIYCTGTQEISSTGLTVIACPWKDCRLRGAVHDILESGFRSDIGRRNGTYYPELKMIAVENGLHHSFVASRLGQNGTFRVDVYPLRGIFPYVRTDGKRWYDENNPNRSPEVMDVRMAILYELARMKQQFLEESPSSCTSRTHKRN